MRERPKPVLGVVAPSPRPTAAGAFWLASVVSVPVFLLLTLLDLLWRAFG
jgi:hypothetical protein